MIDAMKQALEALEWHEEQDEEIRYNECPSRAAMTALRQAIAEAERESTLQEISDIGQEAHTDHPVRHWDRTCPACVAEAEKQEPVAWMYIEPDNEFKTVHIDDCDYSQFPNDEWFPVYTAPNMSTKPENIDTSAERVHETDKSIHDDDDIQEYKRPWVSLTDEEIVACGWCDLRFARAIEAKLRERNT